MKTLTTALLLSTFSLHAFSQECEVKLLPITGKYTGECKDGKANGAGKSAGLDTYEGNFKNGYPDGQGTYTWSVGDFYSGAFKKGLKAGKGEMHFKRTNMDDSIVTGFWEKDKYKGLYENPYKVEEMNPLVSYKNIQKISTKKMTVYFSMENGINVAADVDNFQVIKGYFQRTNKTEMTKTKTIEFQDVQFPFRVKFNLNKGPVDIEFFEPGEWRIDIVLM